MLGFETIVYAENAATTAAGAATATGASSYMYILMQMAPFILLFIVMYWIMIKPQKKKEKELRQKISEMKIGDKVVSIGGIMGKVYKIKDDFVIIETGNVGTPDERSFLKIEKSALKDVQLKEKN